MKFVEDKQLTKFLNGRNYTIVDISNISNIKVVPYEFDGTCLIKLVLSNFEIFQCFKNNKKLYLDITIKDDLFFANELDIIYMLDIKRYYILIGNNPTLAKFKLKYG